MGRPRVIVFDLGGVLLDYAPERRVSAIAAACRTDEDAVRAFLSGPLVRDLDAGLATLDHLARDLGRLAEGRIDAGEAARLWLSVFRPNQTLWTLLPPLSRDYRLACFSNNPGFVRQALPSEVTLDPVILSAEIGALKPEPASFAAAPSAPEEKKTESPLSKPAICLSCACFSALKNLAIGPLAAPSAPNVM